MPAVKSSLVHPAYKTEYRVRNWREYEQGLRARGDVTIWFSEEATANWISRSAGARGGPRLYSDLAIETSLTLRTVFGLPLRQTEGFVGSLLRMFGLDQVPVPDHSTLSRRGFIVAHCLTESRVDDASVIADLLRQVSGTIERFTADGAYDKSGVYEDLIERRAKIVVPPTRKARISKEKTSAARGRNEAVEAVRELGRREWRKEAGYHQQACVENAFYRYKQLIGGRLRSRNIESQATEVRLTINVLNRMLELGAPRSEPIHIERALDWIVASGAIMHQRVCRGKLGQGG